MTAHDATHEKIIQAAKRRFTHYGYGKTTMAELAADCEMSPGNLYRYFPGKLDIAEAICREASMQTADDLARILTMPGRTASQRLHDFLFMDLRETFHKLEEDTRIVEMAQIVTAERPEFHNEGLKREREVLARIIELGNASGEFEISDPEFAAEMIQAATLKFSYPQLFTRLPLEKLERELEGVYQIVVAGLKAGAACCDPLKQLTEA
ncbi:TetR/AcrR family transcriptional regulator [Parvibaculum sp.]|uniref:TetR/AcrR family transcriptional regulator n=1 Tax=Parvibaculum sp. TaxID=2024848 RepID=UPI001DD7F03E|nr:TetR/AcrR family transcriptional regulator [Parvibaculum sp.]MBX3489658.1 TetR/AcrR family transcriptional regulator [Parvibaculum sp.]MCW5726384.1 TetR/AcrR family transcriptional regulator [Parvibaculum sp.]